MIFGNNSKLERKRLKSALKIQCAYRIHLARERTKRMYRSHYVRSYDEVSQSHGYKNKRTLKIELLKPSFLGRRFELPTPRKNGERAPEDYNPGTECTSDGYLVVVTSNEFPIGKWGEVSPVTNADHENLKHVFSHEFIGKFIPENSHFLKNGSIVEFREIMEKLSKECRTDSFLVVYFCTHVLTIRKGEKKNKKEEDYIAFKNTVWGKPVEIAESSVSLGMLTAALNKIKCRQKTIIMNYAHLRKPKAVMFPNARINYPSPNLLSRLAVRANCAVIGCCAVGTPAKDYMKYSPLYDIYGLKTSEDDNPDTFVFPSGGAVYSNTHGRGDASVGSLASDESLSVTAGAHAHGAGTRSDQPEGLFRHRKKISKEEYARLLVPLMQDWGSKPIPDLHRTPRPVKPGATWAKNEEHQFVITMPEQKERNTHMRRLAYWKVRRALAGPPNFFRKHSRNHKRKNFCAPSQMSIAEGSYTVFGRALANAVRGGAATPDSDYVTVKQSFRFLLSFMKKEIMRINAAAAAGFENPDDEIAGAPVVNMSPVLFIPPKNQDALNNPICFRCGPPAAPERPYIIRCGENEVQLEWYNPKFDGVAPIKYKISMKNFTRNFNTWKDLYYPGDITTTRFLVRNIPMGVACQFRIAAYNTAGWGQYSDESAQVTPGEEREVMPDRVRWARLRQGGALAIMDRLNQCTCYRSEFLIGLKLLLGIGQITCGFKNSAITMQVAKLALHALNTFKMDRDIAVLSFTLLGWCMKRPKTERKVRQLCVQNDIYGTVEKYLRTIEGFRFDSSVVRAILFLRGIMPKYLPNVDPVKYEHLVPQPKKEDEEYDDDSSDGDDDVDDIELEDEDGGPGHGEEKKVEELDVIQANTVGLAGAPRADPAGNQRAGAGLSAAGGPIASSKVAPAGMIAGSSNSDKNHLPGSGKSDRKGGKGMSRSKGDSFDDDDDDDYDDEEVTSFLTVG